MVIDANMYWIPEEIFENDNLMEQFLSEIPRGFGYRGYLKEEDGVRQVVIEKPVGFQSLNYVQGEYRLEKQLADMDANGIDRGILKVPCCHEWMSLEFCRRFNDGMAAHAAASNGRLTALAVIPPWGTKECLRELERCKNELGINGVQMCAHYGTLYLDDEAFAPYFEALNELEMTVYVHHTLLPVQYETLYEYNNLRRSYGRCVDQATAVGRELFSGMFEKYPKLKLVHSMMGGGFFAYIDLMLPASGGKAEKVSRFQTDNEIYREYLKNNLFFETSHAQPWGKVQLESAVKTVGADHIVYGSSYPVRNVWFQEGADFIRSLNITEAEKELILAGNAERLYHLS